MSRIATRFVAFAALGSSILALGVTDASAVSSRVESACANDYMAYCSQHDPNGSGVRRCMRANGLRLSDTCVNALIEAGEVSRSEVARRARAAGR